MLRCPVPLMWMLLLIDSHLHYCRLGIMAFNVKVTNATFITRATITTTPPAPAVAVAIATLVRTL